MSDTTTTTEQSLAAARLNMIRMHVPKVQRAWEKYQKAIKAVESAGREYDEITSRFHLVIMDDQIEMFPEAERPNIGKTPDTTVDVQMMTMQDVRDASGIATWDGQSFGATAEEHMLTTAGVGKIPEVKRPILLGKKYYVNTGVCPLKLVDERLDGNGWRLILAVPRRDAKDVVDPRKVKAGENISYFGMLVGLHVKGKPIQYVLQNSAIIVRSK
jgi:hypothetical protein